MTQLYDAKPVLSGGSVCEGTCPKCGSPDQYGDSCEKWACTASRFEGSHARVDWNEAGMVCKTLLLKLRTSPVLDEWTQSGTFAARDCELPEGPFLRPPGRGTCLVRAVFRFETLTGETIGTSGSTPQSVTRVRSKSEAGTRRGLCRMVAEREAGVRGWRSTISLERISYFHTLFWPAVLHARNSRYRRRFTFTAF